MHAAKPCNNKILQFLTASKQGDGHKMAVAVIQLISFYAIHLLSWPDCFAFCSEISFTSISIRRWPEHRECWPGHRYWEQWRAVGFQFSILLQQRYPRLLSITLISDCKLRCYVYILTMHHGVSLHYWIQRIN